MIEDPRLGLPSASSFALDALCPGRQALLKELGDLPETKDEDAERGTMLHEAWEKESHKSLGADDTDIYENGLKLVEQVKGEWGFVGAKEGKREERFYIHDDQGNLAASGQADRHYVVGRSVLVIDFKSLWCRSLVPAELNWQARLLAVLVARHYDAEHVRFAFLKPLFGKKDIVDYNADDLDRAEYSIQQVLWEAKHNPQRRAGAHCRHCKAATTCPEAAAYVSLPSVRLNVSQGVTPKIAEELVGNISLLDCAKVFEGITSRHNIENAIKARLKALPEPTLAELGLRLGKAKVNRPITNVPGAFEFLKSMGIPAARIWAALRFNNTDVVDVVAKSIDSIQSKKSAQDWVKDKLKIFVTEQEQEAPLESL